MKHIAHIHATTPNTIIMITRETDRLHGVHVESSVPLISCCLSIPRIKRYGKLCSSSQCVVVYVRNSSINAVATCAAQIEVQRKLIDRKSVV